MRVALIVVGALALLVVAVYVVGRSLPVAHHAVLERAYDVGPDRLFAIVTDIDAFPSWRSGVKRVERVDRVDRVAPSAGPLVSGARYREIDGRDAMRYAVEVVEPPRRFVTRIADASLPFGGRWTYELTPSANGGTCLRITEDGEVYNPMFRFMARYVFGHTRTMATYLDDLSRRVERER